MRLPLLLAGLIFIATPTPAPAHDQYSNWINGRGHRCCNDDDCRALPEQDERTVDGKLEVRTEGNIWCPVLPHHYLKSGNAANWQTSHVCVLKKFDDLWPCERFVCYQPKPGF